MTPSDFFGNLQYMEEHHEENYIKVAYGVRLAYEAWQNTIMESEYELEMN